MSKGAGLDIELTTTATDDVRLLIGSEYLMRIPEDSHAKHAREAGLIGASVIDIIPGKADRALAEGAQISFEPARGISEIIDDFRRQAIPAFNEIKQAMSQVGRSGEDVTEILANLRHEVERLPATHRAVCGACRNGLSASGHSPEATRSISPRMAIIASQNRSSSVRSSDSVGSTIKVPATGNDIVGA